VVHAVRNLDLTVEAGSVFGFLGPNGAGKTTTIHVLLGFQEATTGTASIFGRSVSDIAARNRIGYLAENPDTYTFLTGREMLVLTGRLFRMEAAAIRKQADRLLETMGLAEAAGRRIGEYSRGMKQRLCMAQSLMNDPDLLILDEPTGGLDPMGRMEIRRIIAERRAMGKTVFFSSHELSEVELVSDRIGILVGGKMVAEGPMDKVVEAGGSLERRFIQLVESESKRMEAT
jgi:ABC-2 type transport system ATP-binding protein